MASYQHFEKRRRQCLVDPGEVSSRVFSPPGGCRISLRRSIARFRIRRVAGIKDAGEACKTNGERAPRGARSPNCMRLETEDGSAFGAKISPLMLVQALE